MLGLRGYGRDAALAEALGICQYGGDAAYLERAMNRAETPL